VESDEELDAAAAQAFRDRRRRPVSTPVRALAAFAYLFPVAAALLVMPAYRQVRLIRVHAISSLILTLVSGVVVLAFGSLHTKALEWALLVGLLISSVMLGCFGLAIWSAIWAYQGRNPPLGPLRDLADRLDKKLLPRHEASSATSGHSG
jgi:uncharacterized membrane protein